MANAVANGDTAKALNALSSLTSSSSSAHSAYESHFEEGPPPAGVRTPRSTPPAGVPARNIPRQYSGMNGGLYDPITGQYRIAPLHPGKENGGLPREDLADRMANVAL